MALVKCKHCGNPNASTAKTCPKCGGSLVMSTGKKVLIVVGVLVILAALGKATSKDKAGSSSSPAAAAGDSPAAAVGTVSESCLELATKFGTSSKLSDLQKEELWPKFKGKAFSWQLSVTEVSSDMLGGFTVQFKCSPQSPSFIQDIQLKYQDNAKPFVMQLVKGKSYQINGVLGSSSTLLGMSGDGTPQAAGVS